MRFSDGIEFWIQGGFGNQLFQIAHAIECSIELRRPIRFNLKSFERDYWGRTSSLSDLSIPSDQWLYFFVNHEEDSISFEIAECVNFYSPLEIHVTTTRPITPRYPSSPFKLFGYFQGEAFFEQNKVAIRQFFTSRVTSFLSLNTFKRGDPEFVFHIRGSDYLHPNVTSTMNMELEGYLRNAWLVIGSPREIEVVTDDPVYADKLLNKANLQALWNMRSSNNQYIDFSLIQNSTNICLANSTFSWWAAYLSQATCVIAPRKWYRDIDKNSELTLGFYPESWLVV